MGFILGPYSNGFFRPLSTGAIHQIHHATQIPLLAAGLLALCSTLAVPAHAGWREWLAENAPDMADRLGIEQQAQEVKIGLTLCLPKETKAWVKAALPGFREKYPNVESVKLVLEGSGTLMKSMSDGNSFGCDLVGAASSVSAYAWEELDPSKATSIAMSELILAMTAENKRDLDKALGDPVSVRNIATVGNKKWRDVGVDRKGKIRVELTDPYKSNSGRVALVTAAYSYYETYDPLDPDMLEDEGFRAFMVQFWDNTKHRKKSTTDLTNKLRTQPSRYTVIFTYGNMIPSLKKTFADELRVLVPEYTVMNDYPMVVTAGDDAHTAVAKAWIAYMTDVPAQQMATDRFFFRPVNPDVRTGATLAQVVPDKELAPVDLPQKENRGMIEAILDIAQGED
jgi:hypothetical protein